MSLFDFAMYVFAGAGVMFILPPVLKTLAEWVTWLPLVFGRNK